MGVRAVVERARGRPRGWGVRRVSSGRVAGAEPQRSVGGRHTWVSVREERKGGEREQKLHEADPDPRRCPQPESPRAAPACHPPAEPLCAKPLV